MKKHKLRLLLSLLMILGMILEGCTPQPVSQQPIKDSAPPYDVDVSKIPDAVPKAEPKSKSGNPKSYVINGHRYHVLPTAAGYNQKGVASWYGWGFHGRNTSTNERYDALAMTAASPNLPLPTYVQVTNLDNGKKVIVKVNDRGPFVPGSNRIIDLSYAAAKKLGYAAKGTAHVLVTAIDPHKWHLHKQQLLAKADKPAPPAKTAVSSNDLNLKDKLYLQIGAFSKRSNAEVLKEKIAKLLVGKPVEIASLLSQAKPLYRVQIGPLHSAQESNVITALLAKHGVSTSKVTTVEKSA